MLKLKNIDGLNILQQAAQTGRINEMNLILEKTDLSLFSDADCFEKLPFYLALTENHKEMSLFIINHLQEKDAKEGKNSESADSNIK